MCYQNLGTQYVFYEFSVKTGIDAKNYENLVTEKDLKPVELLAKQVEDRVADLQKSMKFSLQQGDIMRTEGRLIKDQVVSHGIMSVVFMVVATFISSCFIRSYIKKRKDK